MTRLTRQCSSDRWTRTTVFLTTILAAVALALATPARAQEARGTIAGTIRDGERQRHPRRDRHHHQQGNGHDRQRRHQRSRLLPGSVSHPRHLSGGSRAARLQEGRARGRSPHRRPARGRPRPRGRRSRRVGHGHGRHAAARNDSNASLGNVVDSRRIAQLPTPHGDPYALIGLAAGVTYTGSARLDRPFEPTHIVGYSMDGTRGNRSDLTIDGVPSTATANAGEVIASYVPPADIVQEFKVQTATFDAATGNTEGGVTNLMIKSGTNALRGTAYIGKTPKGLFANDFFANANNIPLSDFDYNRYGGMAGGPMVLPGYDGRGQDLLHVRLRGDPRVAAAQQRHADGADREDAQRRLLGAARARIAVSDLQPLHAPGDCRRPLPAGSVPGQHHPAAPDQPGRARVARSTSRIR